ncbi:MAG: beta-ketoacyl-ACP synthase III [Armatimonadota bacterium]
MQRSARIMGLGSAAPAKVLTNADLESMVDTTDQWILEHTGIRERHICQDGETTSTLCLTAAQQAVERAGIGPEDLGMVICATLTPDFRGFPAVASLVQDGLGATNAGAFDLAAGCTGFVYALTVGAQFVATGAYDHVLVLGSDVLSKITDWTDRASCVLFGDAAGAAVLGPTENGRGYLGHVLASDGSLGDLLCIPVGGSRTPPTPENLKTRKHFIQMEGHEVFKQAVRRLPDMVTRVCDHVGIGVEDIDYLIPHQANQRIMDAAIKRLKIAPEKVLGNLEQYGNTSNGSIPLLMDEADRAGLFEEDDLLVLVGFGAGFTVGGVALRWG